MYLLAEPFHSALGPTWAAGLRRVLADLQSLAVGNGAVSWGRSVGPLALAMTLELSALAQEWADAATRAWWLVAASEAATELEGWFEGGVVTANRMSATDAYRGPARHSADVRPSREVAWSALRLGESPHAVAPHSGRHLADLDRLLSFGHGAAAWSLRTSGISFVLSLCGELELITSRRRAGQGSWSNPSTGSPLLVPTVTVGGAERSSIYHVPGGLPIEIRHDDGRLDIAHDRWAANDASTASRVAGSRRASYVISGRRITVREQLKITEAPADATLTINVGEIEGRSLSTHCEAADAELTIGASGDPEWRTHWGESGSCASGPFPFARGRYVRSHGRSSLILSSPRRIPTTNTASVCMAP